MKNRPLAIQIWLVISIITIGIFLLLFLLIPPTLSQFFARDMYQSIETEQNRALAVAGENAPESFNAAERDQELQDARAVRSVLMQENGRLMPPQNTLPQEVINQARLQAPAQTGESARYSVKINQDRIFYVIRKVPYRGRTLYLISYMWDTYYTGLVKDLLNRLIKLMSFIALGSLFPAMWLARYLSKPLVRLEGFVKKIADRDLNEPVTLNRKDEIGRLAESIEVMRDRLRSQDEYQQSMLQHISHELKTPVMVIRSYTESIRDGIFPRGDLNGSLEVIEGEALRLDKRVRDLLYLTKLDYMALQKPLREEFRFDEVIRSAVDRLRPRRPELDWSVNLEPVRLTGDPDQWNVAVENILDNHIRYAGKQLKVTLEKQEGDSGTEAVLTVWNDGPQLEPQVLERLFFPFQKGAKGQFGLGLTIVKRIAMLHQAEVEAANAEEGGVVFRIRQPLGTP